MGRPVCSRGVRPATRGLSASGRVRRLLGVRLELLLRSRWRAAALVLAARRPSRGSRAAALTLAPSGVSLACSFPLGDGDSLSVCAVVNFFFPKFFLFTFPFSIGRLGRSSENGHSPSHTGKLSSSPILATAVKTHRAADRSWSPLAAAGRLRSVHSSSVHFLLRGANFAIASMPAFLIP